MVQRWHGSRHGNAHGHLPASLGLQSGGGRVFQHSGYVFFSAWDPSHGRELWASDGTTEGTVLVEDFAAGDHASIPSAMTPTESGMYYFLPGADLPQHELRWLPSHTVNAAIVPPGAGTVIGGGSQPAGVLAKISAQPATGYVFDAWTGLPGTSVSAAETRVRITGPLALTARFAAVPTFDQWIESFPLAEKARHPLANPSGDGVPNLLKYAFNLDPAVPDRRALDPIAAAGLPVLSPSGTELRFEYLERLGAPLTYEPQYANTLHDWQALDGDVERLHLSAFWDLVSFKVPLAATEGFFRVRVSLRPPLP